jgi:methyl-accepting chemotaxis protein
MGMKIGHQLKCAAIGILAIGSSSLISVYLNSLGNDSKVVNLAGIVRGGTQRLVKLELAGQPNDKLIEKQNRLVNGLINGDASLGLPVATDPEFRQQMDKVASAWVDLKEQIMAARQDRKSQPELLTASEKYFELADRAVSSAEKYSNNKVERLRYIQIGIFAASLVLLIIIWVTVDRIITILQRSTDDITLSADRINTILSFQGKSIDLQAVAISKTNQFVQGLQDFTQQSNTTAQTSIDLVDRTIELIKKIDSSANQKSSQMSHLQEKFATIVKQIDRLKEQNAKLVTMADRQQTTTNSNKSSIAYIVEPTTINSKHLGQLAGNLGATIDSIAAIADDSLKSISSEIEIAKQTTINITKTISTINHLSLNNRQMSAATTQNANSIKHVTIEIDQLNVGAKETSESIAQIALSANELDTTTRSLKMKI